MKLKRFSLIRFSFLLALGGIFLYSASVQEIHYLFIQHHAEQHEHCDNHLHAQDNHAECNFCKVDLSAFVQSFQQFEETSLLFFDHQKTYGLPEIIVTNDFPCVSLRGPPVLS